MNPKLVAIILGAIAATGSCANIPRQPVEATEPATNHVAAPVPQLPTTHFYVCEDINYKGRCQNLALAKGECHDLKNGFNDDVSSVSPDDGTTCVLYNDAGCSGESLRGIVNPGIKNLGDYGWNDRASSYSCS